MPQPATFKPRRISVRTIGRISGMLSPSKRTFRAGKNPRPSQFSTNRSFFTETQRASFNA
eukprot:1745986-Rhodomonas_salina.1